MTALRKYNEEPPEFWPRDGRTRIYLQRSGLYGVRILPGETYATADPKEAIVTVLGSCVSACVRDPATGFGGMNHFMLPESETGVWGDGLSAAARYGNFAMEALINLVLKAGCPRSRLEIKLFGGANFTAGPAMIGRKNSDFALRYLAEEGLAAIAAGLGGYMAAGYTTTQLPARLRGYFSRRPAKSVWWKRSANMGRLCRQRPSKAAPSFSIER